MSFPAACGSSWASLTSAPRSQGYWRWLRPVAWAREGPAGAETIGRLSGGVAAGASASSDAPLDLDLDGHGLGRARDLDLDRGPVRDPVAERGRGRVEVRDHPAGLLRRGPGRGGRRLGLLAGTALELELVRETGRTAVELGDAVEQPALLAPGQPGAELGELGLIGLARGALGVEVRAQGGEDGPVGLARRLHLRPQLGGEVVAARPRLDLGAQRLQLLPHLGQRGALGREVVAQRGEGGLVGLPRSPLRRASSSARACERPRRAALGELAELASALGRGEAAPPARR